MEDYNTNTPFLGQLEAVLLGLVRSRNDPSALRARRWPPCRPAKLERKKRLFLRAQLLQDLPEAWAPLLCGGHLPHDTWNSEMRPASTHLFLQEDRNLIIDHSTFLDSGMHEGTKQLHIHVGNVSCQSAKGRNLCGVLVSVKQELYCSKNYYSHSFGSKMGRKYKFC